MKSLLAVAVAALAAVVPQPAAHAGSTSSHVGKCSADSYLGLSTTGGYQATIYGAFVLYTTDPGGNPVSGTVRCEIRVNGATVAWAGARGTVVVPVLGNVGYLANDTDSVEFCTVVDYDDDTPTFDQCRSFEPMPLPPPVVWEVLAEVLIGVVDPVACEVLRRLPDVAGVVEVDEEGDVYVQGEPYWDCPPYDIWPPQ